MACAVKRFHLTNDGPHSTALTTSTHQHSPALTSTHQHSPGLRVFMFFNVRQEAVALIIP